MWPHHGIYTLYSGDPAGMITGQDTKLLFFIHLQGILYLVDRYKQKDGVVSKDRWRAAVISRTAVDEFMCLQLENLILIHLL